MHGFPDNLHIWDDLIPHLVAKGRRVVAFDFLGFGASDKLPGASYSFKQQLGDRAAAIREGVAMLRDGDALLIAGKGHETGQIVGDKTLPFSDADEARAALKEAA